MFSFKKFFKKESEVQKLMDEHVEIVSEAVNHWKETFLFYLKGDRKGFEEKALSTIHLETRADEVRKRTQLMLYEGAYLPAFREDLLDLLELVDNIVDDAERGVDFLHIENPEIPPPWSKELKIIVEKSHRTFIFFKEAHAMLQKERSNILSWTHKVQEAEKEVDKLQDRLMAKIFQSEASLAYKLQLRDLILTTGYVSDSSENASDKVGLMAIKGRV